MGNTNDVVVVRVGLTEPLKVESEVVVRLLIVVVDAGDDVEEVALVAVAAVVVEVVLVAVAVVVVLIAMKGRGVA